MARDLHTAQRKYADVVKYGESDWREKARNAFLAAAIAASRRGWWGAAEWLARRV